MKKPILAIMALILVAVALIPTYGEITGRTWIGATYTGYDDYYNADIIAYKEGTTAVLAVTVRHSNTTAVGGLNVTRVYVSFDWGKTYTSTQVSSASPITIKNYGESRVFFINFTVPSTVNASNLYRHSYSIYADYAFKNTTGFLRTGTYAPYFANDFVVYSTTQADAMDLARIIDESNPPSGGWTSAKAKILWNKQENETDSGWVYYEQGDFARAKQRFSTAVSYINEAWDAEEAYLTVLEDLQIQQIQASIRSLDAMTSFFNGLSTMWVLFGIGWVLLGIGYIIKWLRKRPEPQTATA